MALLFLNSWLTFPVMASINTRIGWPGHYWEAGILAFVGYLVIWLLIVGSFAILTNQTTPAIKSFALLVLATGILQCMPESRSGFLLLPCFPWLYAGWMAVAISLTSWLALGLTMLGFYFDVKSKEPGIFIVLFFILNGLLSCWEIDSEKEFTKAEVTHFDSAKISDSVLGSASNPQTETTELGKRISDWKKSKSKLGAILTKLEEDRLTLLHQLRKKGVKSAGDGSSDPRTKVHLDELREVLKQQVLLQRKHDEFDLAILKSESRLRTIERRLAANDAGVNDPELTELTRSMIVLDESLTRENETEVPSELDTLLEQQLNPDRLPQKAPQ